jgi:hypothetical protein
MTMKNWLGFIGSVQPRIIDTSVLGTVKIYITFSGVEVVCKADATVPGVYGSYSLSSIDFNVDCIDVSDGLSYSMIQKQLESRPLELVFDNWITFEGGAQVTTAAYTRFGLSTQSLDMLIGTSYTDTFYNQQQNLDIGSSQIFAHGNTVNATCSAQFGVNNTYFPLFEATTPEQYGITLDAFGRSQDCVGMYDPLFMNNVASVPANLTTASITGNIGLMKYARAFYAFAVRLNHGDDTDSRLCSGVDLRGTTATLSYSNKSSVASENPQFQLVYAKCKLTMSVGKHRQISVVH